MRAMHNAKFDGTPIDKSLQNFREFFQDPQQFDQIYKGGENDPVTGTRRGLRQIMRFGHLKVIEETAKKHKITTKEVSELAKLESGDCSRIAELQTERQKLHAKLAKARKNQISNEDKDRYTKLVKTIKAHRYLASRVRLTDHARLHALIMQILARLIDFAALWERDHLYAALALNAQNGETIDKNNFPENKYLHKIRDDLRKNLRGEARKFIENKFNKNREIRNDLMHFNNLDRSHEKLNLTKEVNKVRDLMSYDRKLKNAVAKSIRNLLDQEGLIIDWDMQDHKLEFKELKSKTICHLSNHFKKDKSIKEDLHSQKYVNMVAEFFGPKKSRNTRNSTRRT